MRTLVLATLATLCLHVGVAAAAGPVAEVKPASFAFGTVKLNDPAKATVSIKNTGDEPLIIQSAKSSCTCLKVTAPTEPILPGTSAPIVAVYDSSRGGPFSKSVTLTLNTESPTLQIVAKGDVVAPEDPGKVGLTPKP